MTAIMTMKLELTRTGAKSDSIFDPKQEYTVHFGAHGKGRRTDGHIEFGFRTNPQGDRQSRFHGYIEPEKFAELALMMFKANPQAAIKAFGAAMQQFEMPQDAERAA